MAKIQARNVDDALFARIEQSAMKNERSLEGEIRIALREYYQPVVQAEPAISARERWQRETGQRLKWLLERLMADNYFREFAGARPLDTFDLVRFGRQLDTSPGVLMDIMEGRKELSFTLADTVASCFDASADWLLGEGGQPFPFVRLGSVGYREFFFPADSTGDYTFEFLRITGGRHDGTLIILRQDIQTKRVTFGIVTESFYLRNGMGSGGYGNLKRFLLFLKTEAARLSINTYDWAPEHPDFDFWTVIGQHHHVYFQDSPRRASARWLQQVLNGEDPGEWFAGGWSPILKEVAAATATDAASRLTDHQDE
ncbi:FitA-like ribbon-helix-helix domain-containing protein [Raoultella planticola]|uniref:FitA-like ribbon-helix-helix domain-containing protein n=1 Tax=Raoultella planticola TaxID=575 RepID=UPI0010E5AF04|nr:hypothetical protein [Raoultella planticola]VTM94047.1 Uncharacterised protein [Raoultella planticola]